MGFWSDLLTYPDYYPYCLIEEEEQEMDKKFYTVVVAPSKKYDSLEKAIEEGKRMVNKPTHHDPFTASRAPDQVFVMEAVSVVRQPVPAAEVVNLAA